MIKLSGSNIVLRLLRIGYTTAGHTIRHTPASGTIAASRERCFAEEVYKGSATMSMRSLQNVTVVNHDVQARQLPPQMTQHESFTPFVSYLSHHLMQNHSHKEFKSDIVIGRRHFVSSSGKLELIKELRGRTGAPMADVKAALETSEYDIDKAFDELRMRGVASAKKASSRVAAEGLVMIALRQATELKGEAIAIGVEVNCETDFVAKNQKFVDLVRSFAERVERIVCRKGLTSSTQANGSQMLSIPIDDEIEKQAVELTSAVREKVSVRRSSVVIAENRNVVVGTYTHGGSVNNPDMGRIGAIVTLRSNAALSSLEEQKEAQILADQIAMHVVGMKPLYVSPESVPEDIKEKERMLLLDQAASTKKPQKVIDKIVDGRMKKLFEDVCLIKQKFVPNPDLTVEQAITNLGGKAEFQVGEFLRMEVGEGIERQNKDFAQEVKDQIHKSTSP